MIWFIIGYALVVLLIGVIIIKISRSRGGEDTFSRRSCPICGAKLEQDDRLFADELKRRKGPSELRIKGCTYCYEK